MLYTATGHLRGDVWQVFHLSLRLIMFGPVNQLCAQRWPQNIQISHTTIPTHIHTPLLPTSLNIVRMLWHSLLHMHNGMYWLSRWCQRHLLLLHSTADPHPLFTGFKIQRVRNLSFGQQPITIMKVDQRMGFLENIASKWRYANWFDEHETPLNHVNGSTVIVPFVVRLHLSFDELHTDNI